MDQHGPTSVLKSVSKLPTDEIVGGVLLNQKVNPQTLAKEEDKLKLNCFTPYVSLIVCMDTTSR